MWVSARCAIRRALVILSSFGLGGALRAGSISGLGGALRASAYSGLGGALRAPLGPVVAPLVPRCALLPAPTPRLIGGDRISYPEQVPSGVIGRQRSPLRN